MLKSTIVKILVYLICLTKNEHRIHKLSSETFHKRFSIRSITDKKVVQNRVISFLELIKDSTIMNCEIKRFGSANDGGYILYPGIDPETSLISCGIGDNASFDFEIAAKVKNIYMYDHTIIEVVDLKPNMYFFKKGVSSQTTNSFTTIIDIIESNKIGKSILKLDIEGMEWEIIDSLDIDTLIKFDQIIIEFHDLFQIALKHNCELYFRVLKKLTEYFTIINVHPNNWSQFRILCGVPFVDTLELTMFNKSIKPAISPTKKILNAPNNSLEPEFILFNAL
jgi:FkbM family methyltransferase